MIKDLDNQNTVNVAAIPFADNVPSAPPLYNDIEIPIAIPILQNIDSLNNHNNFIIFSLNDYKHTDRRLPPLLSPDPYINKRILDDLCKIYCPPGVGFTN